MSKRILWILSVCLSLAMMGLIVVQIKWIKNAFELNDRQFRQLVNTTLNDVSRQIEHYYTSRSLTEFFGENFNNTDDGKGLINIEDRTVPEFLIDEDLLEHDSLSDEKGAEEERLEIISDSLIVIYNKEEGSTDTVNISRYQDNMKLKQVEEVLRKQELLLRTVMKRMLLEDISFEERINQEEFDKILTKNMINRGINLSYEYTVVKDGTQEIYSSEKFTENTDCYYFRASLISDQILDDDTYLYLYFPDQKAHIRESMGFLASSTVILTLLMTLLFSFALYVIFRQKKLSDIKNDFVNNMTHELKTPISTISLASQMLNDESIPSGKKNTAHISRIIQTESKRLGYQVERVLQMAVLDQGHLVVKKSRVGMNEVVSSVIQNFKLQVESRNGKLEVIDEAVNDLVNGDKVHLANVVTNLLDNAVKYSKEQPEIEIHMFNTANNFHLNVKDNGIGISKENQKKVFDRFFRVSTGNIHDVKGFGLGLSYVKLIIEQHGGSISLSSELDKGTKFAVNLPLYIEN